MAPDSPTPGGYPFDEEISTELGLLVQELTRSLLRLKHPLPPDVAEQRVLRPADAALYLGLNTKTLWWHRRHRSGPAFLRLGDTVVGYRLSDLDAWLNSRRVESEQPIRQRRGRPSKGA